MKKRRNRLLGYMLAAVTIFTFAFGYLTPKEETVAASGLTTVQPVVAVTGDGIIGGGVYSPENVSGEKSYTLDELKQIDVGTHLYSALNTSESLSVYKAQGADLSLILNNSGLTDFSGTKIRVQAPGDNYKTSFDPAKTTIGDKNTASVSQHLGVKRYHYPKYYDNEQSAEGAEEVPTIIAWAVAGEGKGEKVDPNAELSENGAIRLVVGQLAPNDYNNPLHNGKDSTRQFYVTAGETVAETALTIGNTEYTRADMLLMERADNTYTYSTSGGTATDYVRGVPMSVLFDGYDEDSVVTFDTADGFGVEASGYTVKQLIDNDYMLAYEKGPAVDSLNGIYETAKNDPSTYGFLTLYGNDKKPAKMVNKITVTSPSGEDYSNSPYKHITNGGQEGDGPYNLDAITGATLTVEGPGVKKSVPVSIRDLEGRDAGIKRADYTDKRDGSDITRKYEGIDLHYILHNMQNGDSGIQLTDKAKIVQIKNRNRRTIAEFTTDQIDEAHRTETPILVAYGTSYAGGDNPRPFVFNNAAGYDADLGNDDGCIKLVYDKSSITGDTNPDYTLFGNMAYIYVAEEETPGYKHDKSPYDSAEMKNYVLTVTGDKIGREINYTVDQLEKMVKYGDDGKPDNTGMGYRDEYSLANSNYWYVNEYEGVQLWKLLLQSGLDPALASDDETIVSSTATDGYASTDKFTTKQVADPDTFGFYEKNPADLNDGTYQGNENIRQGDDVSTGDKLRTGYPVLVAYGVNGYPYVEKASQEGYMSGLENDGGPLRIISGKLKYTHANGSNQAKYLDKIIVGSNENHYSTHKYHDKQVYQTLSGNELQVKVLNGPEDTAPVLKNEIYTVGDVEDIIYGGSLNAAKLKEVKIKAEYPQTKNGNTYSDLYEGVDLNYFLTDYVELPGAKGTITFSNGSDSITLSLEDVLKASGSNEKTGIDGLKPVIAYAKNGTPMVGSKNVQDGYEDEVTLAEGTPYENTVTIKNNGGPLQLLFPTIEDNDDMSEKTITGINSITINLSADQYAHTTAPYDAYKNNTITISGEGTRLTEPKDITVAQLEGKQTLAYTGDYSSLNSEGNLSQNRYRGIDLYKLLTSTNVGLKSNADKVIVTTTDDKSKEFTLSDIRNKYINSVTGTTDMPVILAYGSGKAGTADMEDGLPLVEDRNSEGYVSDYGNTGGPVRLVIGQANAEDVNSGKNMKFVKSIEVTASEMTSWNHNSAEVYRQYLTETVNMKIVDREGTELYNHDYTVAEIEDQPEAFIERFIAKIDKTNEWEGVNFWKFIQKEAQGIPGIEDPIKIEVRANDGYTKDIRSVASLEELENGIKDGTEYKPILLGYAIDGYPLTTGNPKQQSTFPNGEGYDATIGNNAGPIRLVVHNNQGSGISCVAGITITVGDGSVEPEPDADFTIKGLESGDVTMTIDDIKNLKNKAGDDVGKAEGTYTVKGTTKKVKGALLKNILAAQGVEVETTDITLNTPDGFEETGKGVSYKGISLKQAVDQKYLLAYQEWDAETEEWKDIDDIVKNTDIHTNLRMYRNYCEANGLDNTTEWLDECTNINAVTLDIPETVVFKENPTTGGVRSTAMDEEGNLWVGTYGGGLYEKKAGAGGWDPIYNTSSTPSLQTNVTSAVAVDKDGGVWVSQNASYTDPTNNQGVLYMKDGEIVRQYKAGEDPETIPNDYVQAIEVDDHGKVWFGSFGGVTVYDPEADTWTTYSKADGADFPATSCNTIVLDGNGGAWLGFYPEGDGTEDNPYTGGFCHITADGTVDKKIVDSGVTDAAFAQVWTRNIAIDKKGTVWVVASGTNLDDNVGGVIWKWKDGDDAPTRYTGKQIFPDYLDGSSTTEVRVVAVDPDGNLWFGTSADGVLKVDNPKPNDDGTFNVTAQYAKETGSWSAVNMNNIYSIDFYNDGTAYVGSAGGVQILGDEPAAPKENAGDSTPGDADFIVDGDGALKNGYFTIRGLKNTEGLARVTATYSWKTMDGSTGENTFQGANLDNLFKDIIGLADEARSFTVITEDGHQKKFDIALIDQIDVDGNKPMIAWQSDEDPAQEKIDPKLIIGQADADDANKSNWIEHVKEIQIDVATEVEKAIDAAVKEIKEYAQSDDYTPENRSRVQALIDAAVEEIKAKTTSEDVAAALALAKAQVDEVEKKEVIGGETHDTANLRVVGDGVPKNGYFTYKSLKNTEGLNREQKTYSWKNSSGTSGENTFEGAYLDNLLFDILEVSPHAGPVTFVSSDGRTKTLDMAAVTAEDKDGNKPMIAWKSDEAASGTLENIDFKVVFGQEDEDSVNKSSWIKQVVEIRVDIPDTIEHDLAKTDAVPATCTEPGNSEYYTCTTCGKYFSDAGGKNGIEKDSWILPATDHNWGEVKYSWSEDHSEATAERVCANDPDHVETETVETTSEITKAATETEAGEIIYTAEFENPAFGTKTEAVEIPPTGEDPSDDPSQDDLQYKVKEGGGQTWTKGSKKNLEISFKRTENDETTFEHFKGIEVDGKTVDTENYEAKAGSVVINLKPEYLETLETGNHTLTPAFDDGKSESATFKIVSADSTDNNSGSSGSGSGSNSDRTSSSSGTSSGKTADSTKTGDHFHTIIWVMVMLAALVCGAATFRSVRKTRRNSR